MSSPARDMSVMNIRSRTMSAKAKPACTSARFDDVEDRPGLCGDVVRMACAAVGAGVGRARDPARIAHDDRSTVGRRRLPRPARRDAAPARGASSALGGRGAPFEDDGIRGDLEEQAGEHRRPRHDRVDLEVLRRGVVVAAHRPEAVEATGRPCPAVVFASDAPPVAASFTLNPSRSATAFVCSTSRPTASVFSIGRHEHSVDTSTVVPGTSVVAASSRIAAMAASRPSPVTARASTSSSQRSGTTLGRVPPRIVPTLNGHAGPAAVERLRLAHDARRLEDRVMALLGFDAGVRRAAVDHDPVVGDPLAGRHDVAVGAAALEDERDVGVRGRRPDVRRRRRRPDLLVRVRDERQAFERQPARAIARSAYSPARSPAFMSVTPGPVAMLPSSRNGRAAGGARLEHGVHVADQQDPRATGAALEGADHGAAEASVGIRPVLDPGADALHELARPAPDLVDARRDVAAAVDVHQVLEVGEEGRQVGLDGRAQRAQVGVGRTGVVTGIAGSLAPLAILPGPCA